MLIPQTWTPLIVIFRAVFGLFAVLPGFLDYDAGLSHRLEVSSQKNGERVAEISKSRFHGV